MREGDAGKGNHHGVDRDVVVIRRHGELCRHAEVEAVNKCENELEVTHPDEKRSDNIVQSTRGVHGKLADLSPAIPSVSFIETQLVG